MPFKRLIGFVLICECLFFVDAEMIYAQPTETEAAAKNVRTKRKSVKKKKEWGVGLEISGGYDSNIVLEPLTEDLFDDTDSYRLSLGVDAWLRKAKEQNSISLRYNGDVDYYDEHSENDFQAHTASLRFSHKRKPVSYNLRYGYSRYLIDQKNFLGFHEIAPSLIWVQTKKRLMISEYCMRIQNYMGVDIKDGLRHTVSLSEWFFLGNHMKKRLELTLSGGAESVKADHRDYYFAGAGARFLWPLPARINLDLSVFWQQRFYQKTWDIYGVKERRRLILTQLKLSRSINRYVKTFIIGGFSDLDSNITLDEYRKYTASLGIQFIY